MTVKLALYKGRGGIGNALVRWWTGSIYSHCELVVDGWCYSSSVMDKGVRRKRVGHGDDEISLGDNWDLIELPWANGAAIIDYFNSTDSDRYGWPSLIASQLFNRNQTTKHAQFCSEWCARAMNIPSQSTYSPATLGNLVVWVNQITIPGKI